MSGSAWGSREGRLLQYARSQARDDANALASQAEKFGKARGSQKGAKARELRRSIASLVLGDSEVTAPVGIGKWIFVQAKIEQWQRVRYLALSVTHGGIMHPTRHSGKFTDFPGVPPRWWASSIRHLCLGERTCLLKGKTHARFAQDPKSPKRRVKGNQAGGPRAPLGDLWVLSAAGVRFLISAPRGAGMRKLATWRANFTRKFHLPRKTVALREPHRVLPDTRCLARCPRALARVSSGPGCVQAGTSRRARKALRRSS